MSHDTEVFSAFYEDWFGRVYNYARHRTGSASRADEIVADTFKRAFEAWKDYDPGRGDRRTWLFTIAYRAIADHYRGQKAWASLESIPEPRERSDGPAEAAEAERERARLSAALNALEDPGREIVMLKFYGGMSNRAIAGLLGLSESNVAVILFRTIRRMRTDLQGVEADHG